MLCAVVESPPSSSAVMTGWFSSSGAYLLLLVLLPVLPAHTEYCAYHGTAYHSPDWPDCLVKKLPNVLNGMYYIRPESSEVRLDTVI